MLVIDKSILKGKIYPFFFPSFPLHLRNLSSLSFFLSPNPSSKFFMYAVLLVLFILVQPPQKCSFSSTSPQPLNTLNYPFPSPPHPPPSRKAGLHFDILRACPALPFKKA